MKAIVLKHLAREFDLDPYRLRQILRAHSIPTNKGRYQWSSDDPSLEPIRRILKKQRSKPGKP